MMTSRIRILHVIDHLGLGGAQVLLSNLCAEATDDERKLEHEVITLHGDGPYAERLRKAGVKVISLSKSKYNLSTILFRLGRRFWCRDYDAIHLNLPISSLLGAWLAFFFARKPVFVTLHAMKIHTRWPGFYLFALIAPIIEAFITLWPVSRDELRSIGVKDDNIHYIPMGIDFHQADPDRHEEIRKKLSKIYAFVPTRPLLLSVARLSADRHLHILLEAMTQIVAARPEALLLMVGDGEKRAALEAIVRQHSLQDNVIFAGTRTDVWDIFPGCDVYVSMAGGSDIGVAALEAMACSRPVVAYNISNMSEAQKIYSERGLFIATRDSAALAEAILELLCDTTSARQLGESARKLVLEQFSIHDMKRRYQALYQQYAGTSSFDIQS